MVDEEIIFNFDNLIFLVISSIGGWVFVLVRGMSILRGEKVQKKIFMSPPHPPTHTQLFFWQLWPKVIQDHKSYGIMSPPVLSLTGVRTH